MRQQSRGGVPTVLQSSEKCYRSPTLQKLLGIANLEQRIDNCDRRDTNIAAG
ncbi:MAG: hypothetical protein KME28_05105 [Pelatocladus maniniholoensis HA4357-MV3]|uniref:Uncharacterized protein n=1 Tax=Pelatocladus maniniholoensis HA4357-MV3 TaxID=1117104 RepID=A0A9E3H5T5_9NOST|nr:hypothetical protein [Pelatocladus maniniholoensis HA4357-MV3]